MGRRHPSGDPIEASRQEKPGGPGPRGNLMEGARNGVNPAEGFRGTIEGWGFFANRFEHREGA